MAGISPNCNQWVQGHSGEKVRLHSVTMADGDRTGGRLGIYVVCHDQQKLPCIVPFDLVLPDSLDHFATYPEFKIDMAGGLFYPDRGERGPFKVVCGDAWADGMGLPYNQHVVYEVVFKLVKGSWL